MTVPTPKPKPKRSEPTRNRTIRVPERVLRRVAVKLAREDRKFNAVAVDLLDQWADTGGLDDQLTPGQAYARFARKNAARLVPDGAALEKRATSLMDDAE